VKLKELNFSDSYLATMIRALNEIARHVDLHNASDVSKYIALKHVAEFFKANLCDFYKHYADTYGISYVKARYSREHKLPYLPTREELNLIISHANKKYALIYSILRDTGLRPVELSALALSNIDIEKGLLSIMTAKHGRPRIVKVKRETLARLKAYVDTHKFEFNQKLFPPAGIVTGTFCRLRSSIAEKLQNPQIKKIRLYDFRHYYASNLYHETRDLLLTKEMLGHKNIQNTMIYTHLIKLDCEENYTSATAKTVEEAQKLIEQGFEYVCDIDAVKLFRKRK
jgi:integrase